MVNWYLHSSEASVETKLMDKRDVKFTCSEVRKMLDNANSNHKMSHSILVVHELYRWPRRWRRVYIEYHMSNSLLNLQDLQAHIKTREKLIYDISFAIDTGHFAPTDQYLQRSLPTNAFHLLWSRCKPETDWSSASGYVSRRKPHSLDHNWETKLIFPISWHNSFVYFDRKSSVWPEVVLTNFRDRTTMGN